jgi:hypothetical protein
MNVTTIVCPTCSKSLKLTQAIPAGSMVRCTSCGRPFTLFTPTFSAPRPPAPAAPSPQAGRSILVALLLCGLLIAGASVGLGMYFNREKDKAGSPDNRNASLDSKNDDKDRAKDEKEADKGKEKDSPGTASTDKPQTEKKPAETPVQPKKPREETTVRPGDYEASPRPKPDPVEKKEPPPKPDPVKPDPVRPDPVKPDPVKPDPVKPDPVKPDSVKPDPVKPDPMPKSEVKPAQGELPAEEKAKVNEAIKRGVSALLAMQAESGSVSEIPGMTGLAGITLLECEVRATDKAIQKAAEFVRAEAIKTDRVYALATAILFLDRLGDPIDEPLLEVLTARLLAGQLDTGGWTYNTDTVSEDEVKRLEEHYKQAKDQKPEPVKRPRTVNDLAPQVRQRLAQIKPLSSLSLGQGDNSNTQFATLALWVGRRHGVPVDAAFAAINARFRRTQHKDGGWGYDFDHTAPAAMATPSMTCAGILGLTLAHGAAQQAGKAPEPEARLKLDATCDPILRAGLQRLAQSVGEPPSLKNTPMPKLERNDIYYLWSLERIMVVLSLDRLAGKDWYRWGAQVLVANQESSGRWSAEYGASGADTCFALLFLHRANLAKDLNITINKLELIDEDKRKK